MESDLRTGGAWLMRGTAVENKTFTLQDEYRKVKPPRVLEFTWRTDWPEPETAVRFELDEIDSVTTVRLTHSGFKTDDSRQRYQGWPQLLALLRAYVGEDRSKAPK
jgi:uncharacterized protein YndB with AHSA1/START domain